MCNALLKQALALSDNAISILIILAKKTFLILFGLGKRVHLDRTENRVTLKQT